MKTLVIVESPAKAKTISNYLNGTPELVKNYGKFTVIASFGHVRDLKQKDLSVDIQNGFEPTYEIIPGKLKTVKEIIQKAKEHDHIFLASDADLEGHAIAWHIKELCKGVSNQLASRCKRILFQEITKNALSRAVREVGTIDMNKVTAQQARRVLDRILGFKLSPLLWKAYKSNGIGLSAGRVQSAVLKIIVDKERTIEDKTSDCYWTVDAVFKSKDIDDAKFYKDGIIHKFTDEDDVKEFFKLLKPPLLTASNCNIKDRKSYAPKPFITSSLQQEAYNKIGFSIKKTMKVAQELYEKGFITYMRTDSINISTDAQDKIREYVIDKYGQSFYKGTNNKHGNKGHAQEAHECIRPTNFTLTSLNGRLEEEKLQKDHAKLYDMIWKRAVGSLMVEAVYQDLEIIFTHSMITNKFKSDAYFKGTMSRLISPGWLILYETKHTNQNTNENKKYLQDFLSKIKNKEFKVDKFQAQNTWSSPPSRFNEGSIIKLLDTNGIGRPATYASILTKLYDKRYVEKQDFNGIPKNCKHYTYEPDKKTISKQEEIVMIGQEKSRLTPTIIGKEINDFMEKHFAYVVEKDFTASMEMELDKISEGDMDYLTVMKGFWSPLNDSIIKYETTNLTRDKKTAKIDLKNLSPSQKNLVFKIKDVEYQVTTTRYGPAIRFKDQTTGKVQYKDLKQYLRIQKKNLNDIDQKDIDFVTRLPYDYRNGYVLKIGPYGLYVQKNGKENVNLQYELKSKDTNNLNYLFDLSKGELDNIFEKKKIYMNKKNKKE
jgi:DNA topoisomerase-1